MKLRYSWLVVLAVGFTVVSLTASRCGKEWDWVTSFSSNLAAGFLGSFLTVLLIDRAVERERKTQTERIRKLALAQLRPAILGHISVLFGWYKAAVPQPPANQPTKFEEIFNEDYFLEIRQLDFSKPGPTTPPITWFAFTGQEFDSYAVEVRRAIDKYAVFLEPEALELFEGTAHSSLVNAFSLFARFDLLSSDRASNIHRRYNILNEKSFLREVRQHVQKLRLLLSLFNSTATEPIDLADQGFWRTDVAPLFGSARIGPDTTQQPSVPIILGKGPPPTH